jgi:hypothetical protein
MRMQIPKNVNIKIEMKDWLKAPLIYPTKKIKKQ